MAIVKVTRVVVNYTPFEALTWCEEEAIEMVGQYLVDTGKKEKESPNSGWLRDYGCIIPYYLTHEEAINSAKNDMENTREEKRAEMQKPEDERKEVYGFDADDEDDDYEIVQQWAEYFGYMSADTSIGLIWMPIEGIDVYDVDEDSILDESKKAGVW